MMRDEHVSSKKVLPTSIKTIEQPHDLNTKKYKIFYLLNSFNNSRQEVLV